MKRRIYTKEDLRKIARLEDPGSDLWTMVPEDKIVCNDYTVAGAEAILDPTGIVQPLLDAYQWICAQLPGFFHLFHYEVAVAFRTREHLGVVIVEVLRRIRRVMPQCLQKQIFAELVRI